MAENNEGPEETAEIPDAAQSVEQNEALAAPVTAVPAKARLRDRVWSFRAMLAVGVATLLIGGAGGAGIVALADGGNDHGPQIGRFAGGPGGPGGFGGRRGGFGGGEGFGQNGPGTRQFGQGQQGGQQGTQPGTPNPEAPPSGSAS
ncbi:MAG TPA: hypothetical protein VFE15_09620 [Marmoricola sp.]|jgi:hypothetical protein|nr:hypothetical protein [Marmoricola sp.]